MTERVICIKSNRHQDGDNDHHDWQDWGDEAVKGEIYTVRRCGKENHPRHEYLYEFEEISAGRGPNGEVAGFQCKHFRPIRDTSIKIFRAIDRKAFDKTGVDA